MFESARVCGRHEVIDLSEGPCPYCEVEQLHIRMAEAKAEMQRMQKRETELDQRWEAMKADRDKWKARCNEPYDDSVIAENITLNERVAELETRLADARSGLRYIYQQHGELYGVGWDRLFPEGVMWGHREEKSK